MENKFIEQIQHEIISIPIPIIDYNYILVNRTIKFLLNFLLIYLFTTFFLYNYSSISINQFILLFCTFSTIFFYILDLCFPSCYI